MTHTNVTGREGPPPALFVIMTVTALTIVVRVFR